MARNPSNRSGRHVAPDTTHAMVVAEAFEIINGNPKLLARQLLFREGSDAYDELWLNDDLKSEEVLAKVATRDEASAS
jgi:hypothetical protein